MTKALLVIATLASFVLLKNRFAPYPAADSETGIRFFKGTWAEALKKSEQEGKPVFLDIYASWCGPCKKLKRVTFAHEDAGSFFNEHFINVELDGEKGEGRTLAAKYGVRGYPSLFFIDKNGDVITHSSGYRSANELVHLGKTVLKGK